MGIDYRPNSDLRAHEIARVDSSGNDSTGVVGDLSKPFLTVQGAINAIESGSFTTPLIDIGNFSISEDVTTALLFLTFRGSQEIGSPFNSLVLTEPTQPCFLQFTSLYSYGTISAATTGGLTVESHDAFVGGLTNSAGPIRATSPSGAGVLEGTIACAGFDITLDNLIAEHPNLVINSPGSNVTATACRIKTVTACAVLTLIDSRVTGTNNADSTVYADVMLKGVPPGGTSAQILSKIDGADFNTQWSDNTPAGVSVTSAQLASVDTHANTASAAATSADGHANTVSARVVSVSAEVVSLLASASATLESHINTVSARAASISAETVSLAILNDASVSAAIMADVASHLASTSAAIRADEASRIASVSVVIKADIGSVSTIIKNDIASVSAAIKTDIASVSAAILADVVSHLASTSATIKTDIASVSAAISTLIVNQVASVSAAILADVASHINSTSATTKADINSVSAAIIVDVASHIASTSAVIKTDIASVSAAIKADIASVSAAIIADVASHIASTSATIKTDIASVSAAIRADEASHIASTSATIKTDIASVSAAIKTDTTSAINVLSNLASNWVSAIKYVPNSTQTDVDYTLVLGDANTTVKMNSAAAHNVTVPLNATVAFPTGTQIIIEQAGAGAVTIVATGGVTLQGIPLVTAAQYSTVVLIKQAADTWLVGNISGTLASLSAAIMADVASHLTSTSALIKTDIASVSAAIRADEASHIASTSATIKTDIASVSAAIKTDIASVSAAIKTDINSVSAAISTLIVNQIASASAAIKTDVASAASIMDASVSATIKVDINSVSAAISTLIVNQIASVSAAITSVFTTSLLGAGQFRVVTGAQAVTSTFPQKLSGLSLSIAVNGVYDVQGQILWTQSTAGSASAIFQFGMSINQAPAAAAFQLCGNKHAFGAVGTLSSQDQYAGVGAICATPSIMYSVKASVAASGTPVQTTMRFAGVLVGGAGGAGLVKCLVGASTTSNTGINVIAGSYVRAFKIG